MADNAQLSFDRPPNSKTLYEILVGEPWNFEGPDGQNRVLVNIIGIASSQDLSESEFILLKVISPFLHQGEVVENLIAFPRHAGDTTNHILQIGGHVGMWRIRQKFDLEQIHLLKAADIQYFVIGSISPKDENSSL